MVYQFKIQIKGITKPPVWRRVLVPDTFTFLRFHEVIQYAFGWGDYHLFAFTDRMYDCNVRISEKSEYDEFYPVRTRNAANLRLKAYFEGDTSKKLLYEYDFGDSWYHTITLEAVLDEKITKARCVAGKGTCPPEDCGGVGGYEYLKQVFKEDPHGEEARNMREWLEMEEDEDWDVDDFDVDETNEYLSDI